MNTKPLCKTDFICYTHSRTQVLSQAFPISARYFSFPFSLEAVSSHSIHQKELEAMSKQVLTFQLVSLVGPHSPLAQQEEHSLGSLS